MTLSNTKSQYGIFRATFSESNLNKTNESALRWLIIRGNQTTADDSCRL